MRRSVVLAILMLAAGVALAAPPVQDVTPGADYDSVMVFFATDRAMDAAATAPGDKFNGDQALPFTMTYGTATVSIPHGHQPGVMDQPLLQFFAKPTRDIVLLTAPSTTAEVFFQTVAERAARSSDGMLVLVHGYRTSFDNAVRRAAQLKFDLSFDGPVILYSWPSRDSFWRYMADEKNSIWAVPHFFELLTRLQKTAGAASIDVLAHSMGNRIVADALRLLSFTAPPHAQLNQVILTAPDIDTPTFIELKPHIAALCHRLTLYASSHDFALYASKSAHGGPRAGEAGLGIVVLPEMDTIDVGDADKSFLSHSYVFENDSVITDIGYCLRGDAPDKRCRLTPKQAAIRYWSMAESCAGK